MENEMIAPQLVFTAEYRAHVRELIKDHGVFSEEWWESLRGVSMAYIKLAETFLKEDLKTER